MTHLSAHVTNGKLEATLMAEADCNITELFAVKDPIAGECSKRAGTSPVNAVVREMLTERQIYCQSSD